MFSPPLPGIRDWSVPDLEGENTEFPSQAPVSPAISTRVEARSPSLPPPYSPPPHLLPPPYVPPEMPTLPTPSRVCPYGMSVAFPVRAVQAKVVGSMLPAAAFAIHSPQVWSPVQVIAHPRCPTENHRQHQPPLSPPQVQTPPPSIRLQQRQCLLCGQEHTVHPLQQLLQHHLLLLQHSFQYPSQGSPRSQILQLRSHLMALYWRLEPEQQARDLLADRERNLKAETKLKAAAAKMPTRGRKRKAIDSEQPETAKSPKQRKVDTEKKSGAERP